jgi:hypothetical protein
MEVERDLVKQTNNYEHVARTDPGTVGLFIIDTFCAIPITTIRNLAFAAGSLLPN